MIYLDTSVALAHLLSEDRRPSDDLWSEQLFASRLLEYELWTRIHARKLARSHGEAVRSVLARVALLELTPVALARALEPFTPGVRTLDALHLSSALFMRQQGQVVRLASYDERMLAAAAQLEPPIPAYTL